jgi:predicted AlkP superfamily pyrophosphatase or phosphodiesterase
VHLSCRVAVLFGLTLGFAQAARAAEPPVRLVLVIAVDQLRPDRIDESLPGGFGRLVREGRFFVDAALDHGMTETCPGHATMLTGRHPAAAGIPANDFFDPDSGAEEYCAADASEGAAEIGGKGGFSPARLRVTALGDWLHAASPASRVFTVSGKDRGAIMMGGQHPDGAYWYRPDPIPRFTTSRYYRAELPAWVLGWNGADPPRDGFLAALPERWEHGPLANPKTPDDYPGEATRFSRTSPHPLRDPDLAKLGEMLFFTPFLDLATLDFAKRLVEEEKLGQGPAVDLLGLSLSANDSVGHLYGPWSQEAQDHLARVDVALGAFLDFLEARTGGALVVALTADHGVLPLPEWEVAQGVSKCPIPGGRAGIRGLGLAVLGRLWWDLGPYTTWFPRWLQFANSQVRIDRTLLERQGVPLEQAVADAKAALESQPAIAHAWTEAEIASAEGPLAELYRHSFVHGRSGDLVVQVAEGCILSDYDSGTTHGSPYAYDRRVPVLFRGPGIVPGRVAGRAATIDIAPTLATRLGVPLPTDLDGRPLPLDGPR